MKKPKVLDLRTERGARIFHKIRLCYPSLYYYGIKGNEKYLSSKGYTHIITSNNEIIKL